MSEFRIKQDIEDGGVLKSKSNNIKMGEYCFIKRDFNRAIYYLEDALSDHLEENTDVINSNLAMLYHIIGRYEEAVNLYKKSCCNTFKEINYYAFCHRYFNYKEIDDGINLKTLNKEQKFYPLLYNNILNYELSTGKRTINQIPSVNSLYVEQIVNDALYKLGRKPLSKFNDKLKNEYAESLEVIEEKRICHLKKNVGIFVTDIQRHKESAFIYEIVEILRDKANIFIYFNNIFINKLAKQLINGCYFRNTANLSLEEVNNLFYADEIDICIDLAGFGLRNNNIAISTFENLIDIRKVLLEFPLLLKSENYYPLDDASNYLENNNYLYVIGDAKYISNEELILIKNLSDEGKKIIFSCHAFDEPEFKRSFKLRLASIGFSNESICLQEGILPFKKYLQTLRQCSGVILITGASVTELAEAVYCDIPLLVTSEDKMLRKYSKWYGIPVFEKDIKFSFAKIKLDFKKVDKLNHKFLDILLEDKTVLLKKYKNKNSHIIYSFEDAEFSINNTCNGDIVIYQDGKNNECITDR